MNTTRKQKKQDWHRADIVCALRKAGWSLRSLSTHHGYASPTTLTNALDRPWPKGERLIAEAIGIDPAVIWPSRYPQDTAGGAGASHELRKVKGRAA
ncbi:helix-turn-helix domain-containing protein [Sedimenticola hydrogenitrophicus]|uniref:helix-turn-helix domain-containing protein n=1 Tax=Sedimenticola hydrogenitrophicus TaxID=2967975 RepID=UPI0023B13C46|nr:helix-turn-helix domain-containing protein [Sedimenticola hydrogenitrophicus]